MRNYDKLCCFYTNANSIVNKMEEMRKRVKEVGADIAAVTETWARAGITDAELMIEGYNMFRVDRKEKIGGGIILYTRETMEAVLESELTDGVFEEALWCWVGPENSRLLIGVLYRSPTSSANNNKQLLEMLRKAVRKVGSGNLLIMGDFNYPELGKSDGSEHETEESDDEFEEVVADLFLVQHVDDHTRVRQNQRPSRLDLIYTRWMKTLSTI